MFCRKVRPRAGNRNGAKFSHVFNELAALYRYHASTTQVANSEILTLKDHSFSSIVFPASNHSDNFCYGVRSLKNFCSIPDKLLELERLVELSLRHLSLSFIFPSQSVYLHEQIHT